MKELRKIGFVLCLMVMGVCLSANAGAASARELVVFAAASATDALTEIGALFQQKRLGSIKRSFASLSTLAKQIEQGAPADIFLSANTKRMDLGALKTIVCGLGCCVANPYRKTG